MLATNLTELIWNDDLCGLLRLCDTDERVLKHGSDYDRFLAVCKALPLLQGHPLPSTLKCFFKERFDVALPTTSEQAAQIWRVVAQKLLETPVTVGDVIPAPQSAEAFVLPPLKTAKTLSFLQADALIDTAATSWQAWERKLQAALHDAEKQKNYHIKFFLSNEVSKQKPSLFHVNLTLQAIQKTYSDIALLHAQLFRFLCIECQKHNMTLILYVDPACTDAVRFLERMEATVGLARILAVTQSQNTRNYLLDFAKCNHQNHLKLAIDRSHYPSQTAFEREVTDIAKIYPLGYLTVIDGDVLQAFEQ